MLGAVLQTQMDKNYSGLSLPLQCPWAILMCLLPGLAQALLSTYSNSAILLKSLLFPLIYSSFCRWILSLPLPLTQLSILAWRKKKKLSTNLNHFNLMSSTCMLQNSIRYCFVTVPITCQRHFCLLWLSFLSHVVQSKGLVAAVIPVTPVKEIPQLVWKHHASTEWDGEHSRMF